MVLRDPGQLPLLLSMASAWLSDVDQSVHSGLLQRDT